MKTTIQKWGNSLGIRIPSVMAKSMMLENGSQVEILEESDTIIIKAERKHTLVELLSNIDESNVHHEVEVHGPLGRETW